MGKADSVESENGRLPARLAVTLAADLHAALDHPVRREVLRTLNHSGRERSVGEIRAQIHGLRQDQLAYHLQVLRRSGAVALRPDDLGIDPRQSRYASEVTEDKEVRAVLRATEGRDRAGREAAETADASSLLTMFRVPRPTRTIRLRGRDKIDGEGDRRKPSR
jgi:DNA-binding transcriptional ArsR family regulator